MFFVSPFFLQEKEKKKKKKEKKKALVKIRLLFIIIIKETLSFIFFSSKSSIDLLKLRPASVHLSTSVFLIEENISEGLGGRGEKGRGKRKEKKRKEKKRKKIEIKRKTYQNSSKKGNHNEEDKLKSVTTNVMTILGVTITNASNNLGEDSQTQVLERKKRKNEIPISGKFNARLIIANDNCK